jgi:hypothetical protein
VVRSVWEVSIQAQIVRTCQSLDKA